LSLGEIAMLFLATEPTDCALGDALVLA